MTKAYHEGRQAFRDGKTFDENPYLGTAHVVAADDWDEGYDDEFGDQMRKDSNAA